MKHAKTRRPSRAIEKSAASNGAEEYVLRLYVAGTSTRSRRAILRARRLCAGELNGRCKLEVIDIYQQPIRARNGQIVATPTLVKERPLPMRQLIGNLAKSSRLIVGLGLDSADEQDPRMGSSASWSLRGREHRHCLAL
jgi:circadian clock protein KaiB